MPHTFYISDRNSNFGDIRYLNVYLPNNEFCYLNLFIPKINEA